MNNNLENSQKMKWVDFIKKYWFVFLAVVVGTLAVISIRGIYKEEVLHIDPDVEYEQKQGLYLSAGNIDSLNPVISTSEDTYYLSKLIYNSLFEYTDQYNVAPELVESYTADKERACVTILLKEGITWHDGSVLTADDVRFTVNAIKAYGNKGVYYEKVSKIYSVVVENDRNLTIYFSNNYNGSLDDLVFPILSSKCHDSIKQFLADRYSYTPIGTGQYKYSSYDYLKSLVLTPYESFYGELATQDIYVEILPDKSLTPRLLEINSVTCYTEEGSERKTLVADKNFAMYDFISNDVEFLVFNCEKEPFAQKTARQAAAYAIDTKNILTNGYMDDGVLSDNIYYPGFLGVAEMGNYYLIDMDKSKELLSEIGYEDRNLNGTLENDKGEVVNITVLVNNNNSNRLSAAKLLSTDLENVGFSVTVNALPWGEYVAAIEKKQFDILITGYEVKASYDLRELFNGNNLWGYSNSQMLEQAGNLERLYTAEEYTGIYTTLKDMMMEELPYYTLCYKKIGLIGVEYFEVKSLPIFDDIYRNCNSWTWKTVKKQ